MLNPLAADLDHVLAHTGNVWEALREERLFITGGTGFFGRWLLETLTWAVDRLKLGTKALVLTRQPARFGRNAPHLAGHSAIQLIAGEVRTFAFPAGRFAWVIHAAADSTANQSNEAPLVALDGAVQGTRRVLDFAVAAGAARFLLTSSGAVYGKQPAAKSHLSEAYAGGPDPADPASAYGECKRLAELLCTLYHREHGLGACVARCFTFVGPYLPLDAQFAIGNFLRDGLAGGPIRVAGDGTPYRSYLHAADLAIWLWTILLRGVPARPYNVGSEDAVSIADLARRVASAFRPPVDVAIARKPDPSAPRQRYVPSTERARSELGLIQTIDLDESIQRTIRWHTGPGSRQPVLV